VFVVDTSGSMAEKGRWRKHAAHCCTACESCAQQDRFNIISFAGEEHLMEAGLIAPMRAVARAVKRS
jgi:Mg-chelatase subunit ChlD